MEKEDIKKELKTREKRKLHIKFRKREIVKTINDKVVLAMMRGGREMENHFERLWDLFHSIPSLEISEASVLNELYWLNIMNQIFSLLCNEEQR